MTILHVSGLGGNRTSGLTISVPKNVEYGSEYAQVAFYNLINKNLEESINQEKIFLIKDYSSISSLPKPFNNPDIVIFQSMYIKPFIKIYKELKSLNIPYVITPRGALTEKAQNKKKIKKIIGNILFFNKFIEDAASINFLTQNEYKESNKFKFKNYYINGNGIDNKQKSKKFDNENNEFIVTFIGRIEWYHKGLDYLVEAINIGKDEFRKNNFIFNLYGPDDFNSYEKLNTMIKKYEIYDLIQIKSPVFDKEKEKVLLSTDLFIHTSRLEGQPNSVIEAISYGIPVFVTPGTNIDKEVYENKLGFTSDFDINSIKENLLLAYKNRREYSNIGKREIKYAKEKFDWKIIVKKNIEEYKKIIEVT